MLQTRLAALRGFSPPPNCSLCLVRPQSRLQSWQLNHVQVAAAPVLLRRSLATSPETLPTTATKPDTSPNNTSSNSRSKRPGRKRKPSTPKAKAGLNASTQSPSTVNPDLVEKVFESLKHLEQSYAALSKRLEKTTSTEGAEDQKANDGKVDAPKLDPKDIKAKKKLEARISTLSKTLEVMRNVLVSQQIPIDDLRKNKKDAAEKKGSSKPATSPKKKTSSASKAKKITKPQPTAAAVDTKSTITSAAAVASTLAARLTSYSQAVPAAAEDTKETDAEIQTSNPVAPPVKRLGRGRKKPLKVRTVVARKLEMTPVDLPDMPPVPTLAYGLERALFNPGVYQLQDQRSKVFNFDPYLSKIMPLNEFDFSALQQYITSSKDSTLYELAAKLGKKYSGSTSSMTSLLSHFHYLISAWRPISTDNLSGNINPEYKTFTRINRAPAATFLHVRDGIYAIDADKEYDTANILSMLGKSMEKLLTLDKEEFERYRHKNSDQITEEERNASEAYHFSTMGDFLMRSQLDATDKRLPGTGMFDLKTRAVLPIRMDATGFQKGLGYEIRQRFGEWESFEREYYDMIRSAFLKYSLQVRMGRMDGIFVAFHNTQRIFGFQYIPLEEMDQAIHGSQTRHLGDLEFKLSLHLLNKALDRATERFPGKAIRLHVETRPGNPPFMYIFAKPVSTKEIDKVQSASKAAVAQFERQWLGFQHEEAEAEEIEPPKVQHQMQEDDSAESVEDAKQSTLAFWEEMQDKVEEAVEDDARGISHVRESIQDALEQSGLLQAKSTDEARTYVDALLDALVRSADYEIDDGLGRSKNSAVAQTSQTTESVAIGDIPAVSSDALESDNAEPFATRPADENTDLSTPGAPAAGENVRVSNLGLKDLIRRITEHVDEKPEETDAQVSEEEEVPDVSRLRDFERILSELVSTSRKEDDDVVEAEEPMSIEFDQSRRAVKEDDETVRDETEDEVAPELDDTLSVEGDELLGMHLTIRNKVNGHYVERPEQTDPNFHWSLEYSFEEIPAKSAKTIYSALQTRRSKVLNFGDADLRDKRWHSMWRGKLRVMSAAGRSRRDREDLKARQRPVHVVDRDEPLTWEEAFSHHEQWVDTTSNKK